MMSFVVRAAVPFACAWAKRQESIILKTGVPLSASQAETATKLGILHPERVRLRAVVRVPPVNWLFRRVGRYLSRNLCRCLCQQTADSTRVGTKAPTKVQVRWVAALRRLYVLDACADYLKKWGNQVVRGGK